LVFLRAQMMSRRLSFEYERAVGSSGGCEGPLASCTLKESACSTIEMMSAALNVNSDGLAIHFACRDSESACEGVFKEPPFN